MRLLRTNTATRVTVGPFFTTDGVTPATSLTVTSCKLTMLIDVSGVPTLVLDTSPTASGGNNDMVHVTGDDAGFYDLELTATNTNNLGRAILSLTNASAHIPVWHEFMIVPSAVYDSWVLDGDLTATMKTSVGTAVTSSVSTLLTTALPDSVPSVGTRPSVQQALYMVTQILTNRAVTGTSMIVRKADGTTTLMEFTLDDPSSPDSITRTA